MFDIETHNDKKRREKKTKQKQIGNVLLMSVTFKLLTE